MQEVCADWPRPPYSLVALAAFGGCMLAVMSLSKKLAAEPDDGRRHEGMPLSSLPGGVLVWGFCPMVVATSFLTGLYFSGPAVPPNVIGIDTVNRMLSESFLPAANSRISDYIPESKGDCEALWHLRVRRGQASPASILQVNQGNLSAVYEHCHGRSPLTHMSDRSMDAMAQWATGLNTLQIKGVNVSRPQRVSANTQVWRMYVSGMFLDVHVWLKVMLAQWGTTPWLDDYMCCDKNFNFTVEVSMSCTEGIGFAPARLRFLHIDKPELHHQTCSDDDDSSMCMEWVYPSSYEKNPHVHAALNAFLTGRKGRLMMKTSDGTITDVFNYISNKLTEVVKLNSAGDACP